MSARNVHPDSFAGTAATISRGYKRLYRPKLHGFRGKRRHVRNRRTPDAWMPPRRTV